MKRHGQTRRLMMPVSTQARTKGKIDVISPTFSGRGLAELREQWKKGCTTAVDATATDAEASPPVAPGSPSKKPMVRGVVCDVAEALQQCIAWTSGASSSTDGAAPSR